MQEINANKLQMMQLMVEIVILLEEQPFFIQEIMFHLGLKEKVLVQQLEDINSLKILNHIKNKILKNYYLF